MIKLAIHLKNNFKMQ